MRIAVTGGTGFIGRHLARHLILEGHEVVLLARGSNAASEVDRAESMTFVTSDLSGQLSSSPKRRANINLETFSPVIESTTYRRVSSEEVLLHAFSGCDAVAHCAGINREIGNQTYRKVHVKATQNVVSAAKQAGVKKIALMSFLRARPNCGSPYHESKWAAEEIVRNSGLDYTIVKAGMVYGRGDHMLDHLSHALHTFPLFAMVGLKEKGIRPLAVEDLVEILQAALVKGRLSRQTVAVTGAEELYLSEAVRRGARVSGNKVRLVRAPRVVPLHAGGFLGIDNEGAAGGPCAGAHSFRRSVRAGAALRPAS